MEFIKKILILFVVVLFIYILLRLLQKRADIISNSKVEGFTEGLTATYTDPKVIKIAAATKSESLNTMKASYGSQPISDFFVKSSLDSAYNGSSVTVDMVNYVLSRGYRFLDFEVYLEALTTEKYGSKTATVGYTDIVAGYRTSENNIKLSDVLTAIMQGAFTNTSPNSTDPLFLHIRPMYQLPTESDDSANLAVKQGNNTQLNTQIEAALELLSGSLAGLVSPSTTVSSISEKIVLIMDSTDTNGKKSAKLKSMISIDPSSKYMNTINTGIVTAKPVLSNTQEPTPDPSENPESFSGTRLIITLPFDETGNILTDNPNTNSLITQFAPNFSPMMAWLYNSNSGILASYENLFINNGKSAFIEMSSMKINSNAAMKLNSPIVGPS